jgi:transglycosylase-like protein with SLT domain
MMPAYQNLLAWVLATMFSLQPAYDEKRCWWGVTWTDTYEATAEAFVREAYDHPLPITVTDRRQVDRWALEGVSPVVFTAALELVWAAKESRFKPDAVGDRGSSLGVLQVSSFWARSAKRDPEDLLDVEVAVPVAVVLFHTSFEVCRDKPFDYRMSWYAAGGSGCDRGQRSHEISTARINRAIRLARTYD